MIRRVDVYHDMVEAWKTGGIYYTCQVCGYDKLGGREKAGVWDHIFNRHHVLLNGMGKVGYRQRVMR